MNEFLKDVEEKLIKKTARKSRTFYLKEETLEYIDAIAKNSNVSPNKVIEAVFDEIKNKQGDS